MTTPIVTIAIPVYKRLDCLHLALQSIAAQDYPHIELIVSDNGLNGTKVLEIVAQYFTRPYVFRQNAAIVNLPAHYNQLVQAASGLYFVWMPDDDTISPNYISELVPILEQDPHTAIAIARHEYVDASGHVLRTSPDHPPHLIPSEQLIEQWTALGYESFTAILARTTEIRDCGGYPDFPGGTHCDDALLVKLCLNRSIAFTSKCTYRLRIDESSVGWSLKCQALAEDSRRFLGFLDADPTILAYAGGQPGQWAELRKHLVRMTWETYFYRWVTLYRQRMPTAQWVRAGFALPYIPEYYREVRTTLGHALKEVLMTRAKKLFPWAHKLYRAIKYGGA